MPTLPGDQQQSRHFLPAHTRPQHYRSQSYQTPRAPRISPLSAAELANTTQTYSTPPSPTNSPPSQLHNNHSQAGRARPMYMPAVLRPCDEFPSTRVARRKTASSTSSSDSESTLRRANSALMSLPGLALIGQRLGADGTTKTLGGEWNVDSFPRVSGQPTRTHWKVKKHTQNFSLTLLSPC